MIKISAPDKISYLLERKFPNIRILRSNPSMPHVKESEISKMNREKQLKALDDYEAELRNKPSQEIAEMFEKEKLKELDELKVRAEIEENNRFFNKPSAEADFEHWSKATYWTLDEALALAFGKDPETVNWASIESYKRISPFVQKYARTRDLAQRALKWRQLYDPVSPGIFLAWAKRTNLSVPSELIALVEKQGVVIADWKDMYDKVRETYDEIHSKYLVALDLISELQNQIESPRDGALTGSIFWNNFESKASLAISTYPAWRKTVKKVQKTGNLMDWLKQTVGADDREAEFLKKVLSDFFEELK